MAVSHLARVTTLGFVGISGAVNHTKQSSLTQDPIVALPWEKVKPIELQVGWWGWVVVMLVFAVDVTSSLSLGPCALFPEAGAGSLEAILIYSLIWPYQLP